MATNKTKRASQSEIRSTALRQALNIEEKKRLKTHVADLVLEAYDLPSLPSADPARPAAVDIALFRKCLNLFQPSDLDDLIKERNIDNRCGYALCPRPNRKIAGGGEKVWNQKGGKDFRIVDREEMERWCSKACANRTAFLSAQLSPEPSWLRETQNDVRLLDEIGSTDDLSGATKALIETVVNDEAAERFQALSLERGEDVVQDVSEQIPIIEKSNSDKTSIPPSRGEQSVEGYRPRKVHFAQTEMPYRTKS